MRVQTKFRGSSAAATSFGAKWGELREGLKQKRTEAVTHGVTERWHSHRIMSARERKAFERDAIPADRSDEFVGQFVGEGGIVAAADRQDFSACSVQTGNIRIRTDRRKVAAYFFERNFVMQGLPDVRSGKAGGDHVAKIGGDVQERTSAQSGFVRDGEKPEAGANARAEDAEAVIALLFKPAQSAARIQHRLAIGL